MNFSVGDRVRVTEEIDLEPYTTVRVGEVGTITQTGPEWEIELDAHHPGLDYYRNRAWVDGTSGLAHTGTPYTAYLQLAASLVLVVLSFTAFTLGVFY